MKIKINLISASALLLLTVFLSTSWNSKDGCGSQTKNSGGAPAGYANDPYGGYKDCTGCHDNFASAFSKTGMITSNIPAEGYTAGSTYTITAKVISSGSAKFGFENTVQNSNGTMLGTLIPTNTSETQLKGTSVEYITHKASGTSGNGSRVWTYNWTAPASGMGPVTFYGAFIIVSSNGDSVYVSTTVFKEAVPTGTELIPYQELQYSIYPTITSGYLTVKANKFHDEPSKLSVYSVSGKNVYSKVINSEVETIYLNVVKGLYFIEIRSGNFRSLTKIVIVK